MLLNVSSSKYPLQVVFKIVPLEGALLVNGEVQKRSEEILAEVAIALTLSRLRDKQGICFPVTAALIQI